MCVQGKNVFAEQVWKKRKAIPRSTEFWLEVCTVFKLAMTEAMASQACSMHAGLQQDYLKIIDRHHTGIFPLLGQVPTNPVTLIPLQSE